MGVAYYVALESEIEGLHTFMNGYALSKADSEEASNPTLTQIASDLDVTPLIEFVSASPDDVLVLLDPDDPLPEWAATLPAEEWFDAAQGLSTVDALIKHLEATPDVVQDQVDVITDLRQMTHILTAADRNKVRWHLAVDI